MDRTIWAWVCTSVHGRTGAVQPAAQSLWFFVCAFAAQLLDTRGIARRGKPLMHGPIALYMLAAVAALTGFAGISGANRGPGGCGGRKSQPNPRAVDAPAATGRSYSRLTLSRVGNDAASLVGSACLHELERAFRIPACAFLISRF